MVHTLLQCALSLRHTVLLNHLIQLVDPQQSHLTSYQVSHLGGEVIVQGMPAAYYQRFLLMLDPK